jgi:hypothetical protein
MDLLLYFVSFGSMFALVVSIFAGALWVFLGFCRAWGRFFQALANPQPRPRNVRIDPNPYYLKRAGQ